jgi:putative aldouronate transport system substrate-binding protein
MKLSKKIAAGILAGLMAATLLTGCGDKSNTVDTNNNTATQAPEPSGGEGTDSTATGDITKPESIDWMVHSGMNAENGVDQWADEYTRLTGIDMNIEVVSNNEYAQILELAFASGDVPDLFDLSGDNLAVYAEQNAIADLTDLIKNSEFYDRVDPAIWESITLDGKIYGVPFEIPSGAVSYVRKDWLDRLGMDIPKTYEEFTTMLTRFKNEIPECKVPLTAPGLKASMNLPEFFQGANPNFTKVDGKWVDGMSQDNMVTALQRLQDSYKAGLIDLEVVTNTTSSCRDQWYSGSVGVFNYWGGIWGQTLTERLKVNVPDAEVVAIPPIEGAVYEFALPSVICINGNLSAEKVAQLFKYFVEYSHDGGEGQVLFQSGVEGLHWEQDGNNVKALPTLSNPDEVFQKAWITPWIPISPLLVTDKNSVLDQTVIDSLDVINTYGKQTPVFPVSATLIKIKSDLTLIKEEVIAKVVMGDMTVEDGIAKYKEEADMLGVSKIIEEMNQ